MASKKGALTLAEGRYDYRTDVSIILNNGRDKKDFVVRTSLQGLSEWKARYAKSGYPFKSSIQGAMKEAYEVEDEL